MSETALELSSRAPLAVTQEQVNIARNTVAKGLDDDQFAVYLYNCQRQGIHPLDGLVVPVVRTDDGQKKLTFVTTVDLLRSRAADTDEYAGSDDAVFEYQGEKPTAATVTVWRFVQGQKCSFTATARYDEYYPGEKQGFMWRSKPHVMLGKCAEGLALRKAFPKQLAGLYLQEELQKDEKPAPRQNKPAPAGVKCSECGAEGGHLPKCSKKQGAKMEPAMCGACGKIDSHDPGCKYGPKVTNKFAYMILDLAEKKTKKGEPYLILEVVAPDNSQGKLYCWHRSMYDALAKSKGQSLMCEVSAETKDGKTFYQLEHILELGGVAYVSDKPAEKGTADEDF